MNKILINKEVPYIFTLLIAMIAYQINLIITDIKDSPVIEYSYSTTNEIIKDNKAERNISCKITNVSKSHLFKNIKLYFVYEEQYPTKIYNPNFIIISPSSIRGVEKDSIPNRAAIFTISWLQPEQQYELKFNTVSNKNFPKYPKIYFQTDNSVRLSECSISTFLSKNFATVNIFLCLLWLIIIIIYIKKSSKLIKYE